MPCSSASDISATDTNAIYANDTGACPSPCRVSAEPTSPGSKPRRAKLALPPSPNPAPPANAELCHMDCKPSIQSIGTCAHKRLAAYGNGRSNKDTRDQ
jgi:hypothetical protein